MLCIERSLWSVGASAAAAIGIAIGLAAPAFADQPARITRTTAIKVPALEAEIGKTVTRSGPLGTVSRELYVPYPRPNVSSVISCDCTGATGLRRYERLCYQVF